VSGRGESAPHALSGDVEIQDEAQRGSLRDQSPGETLLFPPGLDHAEFGAIVSGVEALLADTEQSDWQDRFEWMARASG